MNFFDQINDELVSIKAVLEELFRSDLNQKNAVSFLLLMGRVGATIDFAEKLYHAGGKKGVQKASELAREISELLDSEENPFRGLMPGSEDGESRNLPEEFQLLRARAVTAFG